MAGRCDTDVQRYEEAYDESAMMTSMQPRTSAQLLVGARHRAGLTQTELQRRTGIAQTTISAYEAGRQKPAFETVVRLVNACGYDLDVEYTRRPLSGPLGARVLRERDAILEIIKAAGGDNVRVFGSVARGEDTPDSDVDLLLDIERPLGLITLGRVQQQLEALLEAPVDLVPSSLLKVGVSVEAARDQVLL